MRIIAGSRKGHRIAAPRGDNTRPTGDRVREALFNMLGPLDGASVADLFAGSGALGIEALSRGAAVATFVESDPPAVAAIRENLAVLGADGQVRHQDALAFLASAEGRFDLVLADPPYDSAPRLAGPLAERLPDVLSETARIVTESDKNRPLELPFPILRERAYRDIRIAIHAG